MIAVEGTTGWRFVAEEVEAAGGRVVLAEPGETRALRGPKRRAKTDRGDARWLRELLERDELPVSWIPPAHLLELRCRVQLRQTIAEERRAWLQRIHAQLFHHGIAIGGELAKPAARDWLATIELSSAGQERRQNSARDSRLPRRATGRPRSRASSLRASASCHSGARPLVRSG